MIFFFSFKNLFDYAKNNIITPDSPVMKHFEELQSYDFEIIIKYLENALLILKNSFAYSNYIPTFVIQNKTMNTIIAQFHHHHSCNQAS